MERVLTWMVAAGYPKPAADWLRQRRRAILMALALLSWALFLGIGWLVFHLLF